jgi:hypothetical protein
MHPLEPEVIADTRAGLIQQFGVGLEGVDIPAASARGIMVCNVPGDVTTNADSTAEHAVFLMLGLARRIHACGKAFQHGLWGAPMGSCLLGGTALIVGFGRVGKALAHKLVALGMNVIAVRRTPDPKAEREIGLVSFVDTTDLLEMLPKADFVISGLSLNDRTRGLLDSKEDVFQEVDNEVIVGEESSDSTDNPEEKQLIHKGESILLNVDAEQHEAVDSCDVNLAVGRKKKVLKKAGPKKTTDVGLGRPKKKKAAPDASEEGFNLVSEKRKKMPAVSEPPSTSAAPSAKVDVMQNRGEFSKFLNSLYTFKTPNILHRSLCLV